MLLLVVFKYNQLHRAYIKLKKNSADSQGNPNSGGSTSPRVERLEKDKEELEKELQSLKLQLVVKGKEGEDKSRLIESIDDKLRKIQGNTSLYKMSLNEIIRMIDTHKEKRTDTFKIHLDEVNQQFTQRLKSQFPLLTLYDLRLCTYIKTGLSTREIAEMMHVLPSSINVSRSRLRKKLHLDIKDDLFSFLESI